MASLSLRTAVDCTGRVDVATRFLITPGCDALSSSYDKSDLINGTDCGIQKKIDEHEDSK